MAGKKTRAPRRPAGFWSEFNVWWRGILDSTGQRPTTTEVHEWYDVNAEVIWPDINIRPCWKDTRLHAKCLRSTEEIRNYFREYRAGKKDEGPRGRKHRHDDTEEEDDEDMPEDSTGPDEGPEAVPSHPVFNPNLMSAAGASVDVLSGILLHNARVQQVALEQQGCGPLAGYSHAGQMGLYGTAGMHPAPMIDPFRQTASPTHTASEQSHGLVEAGTPRKSPFANIPPMSLGMPQMPANGLFFGAGNPPGGGQFLHGEPSFAQLPHTHDGDHVEQPLSKARRTTEPSDHSRSPRPPPPHRKRLSQQAADLPCLPLGSQHGPGPSLATLTPSHAKRSQGGASSSNSSGTEADAVRRVSAPQQVGPGLSLDEDVERRRQAYLSRAKSGRGGVSCPGPEFNSWAQQPGLGHTMPLMPPELLNMSMQQLLAKMSTVSGGRMAPGLNPFSAAAGMGAISAPGGAPGLPGAAAPADGVCIVRASSQSAGYMVPTPGSHGQQGQPSNPELPPTLPLQLPPLERMHQAPSGKGNASTSVPSAGRFDDQQLRQYMNNHATNPKPFQFGGLPASFAGLEAFQHGMKVAEPLRAAGGRLDQDLDAHLPQAAHEQYAAAAAFALGEPAQGHANGLIQAPTLPMAGASALALANLDSSQLGNVLMEFGGDLDHVAAAAAGIVDSRTGRMSWSNPLPPLPNGASLVGQAAAAHRRTSASSFGGALEAVTGMNGGNMMFPRVSDGGPALVEAGGALGLGTGMWERGFELFPQLHSGSKDMAPKKMQAGGAAGSKHEPVESTDTSVADWLLNRRVSAGMLPDEHASGGMDVDHDADGCVVPMKGFMAQALRDFVREAGPGAVGPQGPGMPGMLGGHDELHF